jgi:thioredoxin reductase
MSEFYDVIVVGGGAAGVGAAVGASLAGARTALLERGRPRCPVRHRRLVSVGRPHCLGC